MRVFGVPARPLSFPAEGIRRDGLLYRLPSREDLDTLAPAFQDKEIAGGANLPPFSLDELRAVLAGLAQIPRTARFPAEYAFSLGVGRVEARVNAGNPASERVLERAGFTREGVIRSLLLRDGRRLDQTLYSLLPGE